MGLDVFLRAHYFIGGRSSEVSVEKIDWNGEKEKFHFKNVKDISVEVGYWRKANQIHKWFVDNVQEGEDNCKEYYVSEEDLDNLENVCRIVLMAKGTDKEKEVVEESLPPCKGFFFGSTGIDDYYFDELEDTLKIIEKAREAIKEGADIYYSSSW